jgi:hypothetical protein
MVKLIKFTDGSQTETMAFFLRQFIVNHRPGSCLREEQAAFCEPDHPGLFAFERGNRNGSNHRKSFGTHFLDRLGCPGVAFCVGLHQLGNRTGDKDHPEGCLGGGEAMRVKLSPEWVLTTDHASSSYGRAVLVNEDNGNVYGPADFVSCYPESGFMMARYFVEKMALKLKLTEKQAQLVASFIK